jgi:histidine triad (HIT) family protein
MIANGTILADIVWQDENVVAFRDLHPQAPVHILIIPREHYSGMDDDVPAEVHGALCEAAPRVAEAAGVAGSGYRLIINTGPDAGQSVLHLHVHLLGGAPMSEGLVRLA